MPSYVRAGIRKCARIRALSCTLRHSYCTKHLLLYQTQTEALSNEIFQSLDSGDAQIEN